MALDLGQLSVRKLIERYHAILSEEHARPRGVTPADGAGAYETEMEAVEGELLSRPANAWLDVIPDEDRGDAKLESDAIARARWNYLGEKAGGNRPLPRRQADLAALSTEEIVERFVALAIEQDAACMEEAERLYWLVDSLAAELQWREGDHRRVLLALYTHPNIAVRAKAADLTMDVEPALAASRLSAIDDPDWTPTSGRPRVVIGDVDVSIDHVMTVRRVDIGDLTVGQLVERFVAIGVEQEEAEHRIETQRFNRLYGLKQAVVDELKARPGDQRRALVDLFGHGNIQVRLNAAKNTLAVEPDGARRELEAIKATGWQPQAMDAGMSLRALDRGEWMPT